MVVWPEYISLTDWAGNLIASYPNEFLPILDNEDKWEEWGAIVASTGIFAKSSIPAPFSITTGSKKNNFKEWTEWAKIVYTNINYQPKIR